jgi:hypothetical protein
MMSKLIAVIWFSGWMVLCSAFPSRAAEPLDLYGYYHAQTINFGFLMDEVADFSNLVLLEIGRFEDTDDIFNEGLGIPRALDLGYKIILGFETYSLPNQFNPEVFEQQVGLTALKLREAGYLNPESIFAVFPLDEPWNHGYSFEDEELALEIFERYFPGIPKMINYSINQLLSPDRPIPAGLDIVGMDAYFFQQDREDMSRQAMESFFETGMEKIRVKAPGKPVVFLAQSFAFEPSGHFMPAPEQMDWQVEYSLKTPEIIGHMWFMLGSGPTNSGVEIRGVIDFPEQLQRHRELGLDVLELNSPKELKSP